MSRRIVICINTLLAALAGSVPAQTTQPVHGTVRVDTTPAHILNSFDPDQALGSSIDVLSQSGIDQVYTPHIIQECLSAGWGPITFRNNSELRMAAWHWNDNGTWSDAANQCGYFTGSTELKEPLKYILSYALPHRGFATSGDAPLPGATSYWKSNPYLTSHFTGESDALHPQWIIEDMRLPKEINAVKIAWVNPYATAYAVQYWSGDGGALDFDDGPRGDWTTFPNGQISNAPGGPVTLRLCDQPIRTQFVRILMTASSNTPDDHGAADIRNCVGYAMQSLASGTINPDGTFTDSAPIPQPAPSAPSTRPTRGRGGPSFCASSIDPWHSASTVVGGGRAQHTGFDTFFTSGLTNGLPAMIPVTLLYGTPDDAAAQIAYIEKRGYPIGYIEMGEEPDGKHCIPEDYAALYLQWAAAIHKIDPTLKLGGPIFEGVTDDITVWPDAQGRTSWMGRFVAYLKDHGRIADLAFVSFEHYPFDSGMTWKDLYDEPRLMKHILQVWRDDGVPPTVPLMVTESSMAAGLIGPMSRIDAAIWLSDSIGSFFQAGGAAYYHSPIQPQPVEPGRGRRSGSASWSNFVATSDYQISGYTSFYWAAHMINLEWVQHRSGIHQMFPSIADIKDSDGNALVTSYAVHRPDGNWSLMLVNRDQNNPHTTRVEFDDATNSKKYFDSPVTWVTFGSDQYVWHDQGAMSFADPDGPPVAKTQAGGESATYLLPKASVTILRGKLAN